MQRGGAGRADRNPNDARSKRRQDTMKTMEKESQKERARKDRTKRKTAGIRKDGWKEGALREGCAFFPFMQTRMVSANKNNIIIIMTLVKSILEL